MNTQIRLIEESDVPGIAALYRDVYGDNYPFREFYDEGWIKRGVFDSDVRWYVAVEHGKDQRLLGSAAVMLNVGDADDMVAELGRLVVHPAARGQSLGSRLMQTITEEGDRLSDFSFAEARTAHPGSQIILSRGGFQVVGLEPLCYNTGDYESAIFYCRLSENARALRRGRPAIIPEAFNLAGMALGHCALPMDATSENHAAPYPSSREDGAFVVREMEGRELLRVLRLSKERFTNPEVFGAFRLEHGLLKLKEHQARYLVLMRGDVVVAGLGYTWDPVERKGQIFEFVGADDLAKGTLLEQGVAYLERTFDPRYLSIDVNAYTPRIQQSLKLLGFAPVVYAPSMVYVMGERLDVIRFVKLRMEPAMRNWELIDQCRNLAEMVENSVLATTKGHVADENVRRIRAFQGLTDLQAGQAATLCQHRSFRAGEILFEEGSDQQSLFFVLEGAVDILLDGVAEPLTTICEGESFGEIALIEEVPRSATAVCREDCRLLVMQANDFDHLVRLNPEAGAVILRNLAKRIATRLRELSSQYQELERSWWQDDVLV